MKFLKPFMAAACATLCAVSFSACAGAGKSTLLGEPEKAAPVTYEEIKTDEYKKFKTQAERFASAFAPAVYRETEGNYAVSPVSVYMALSLAAECAAGDTRDEILSALGVTHTELQENYPIFYRSLMVERKRNNKVTSTLIPSNSIWVNEGTPVNTSCIDSLSKYYYAYSYSADFKNDNVEANAAVRKFVKEQTKGIIDKDFNLSKNTLFTLINTLYLKTIWNDTGDDLGFTDINYDFTEADGTVKQTKLLQGYYNSGRVYKTEKYSSFFTRTYDGYKIKFILPNDGYSVKDAFTSENIFSVNTRTDYNALDKENNIEYLTRCIFPEFKADYDEDIQDVLKEKFGINKLFNDPGITPKKQSCDFSTLSTEECYCSRVQHVADLTVDKKGIEGAAVTAIIMDEATSVGPKEYEIVREDFVIDRAFGFIITDSDNVALFSGVIENI